MQYGLWIMITVQAYYVHSLNSIKIYRHYYTATTWCIAWAMTITLRFQAFGRCVIFNVYDNNERYTG